jgi:hypothetical protein
MSMCQQNNLLKFFKLIMIDENVEKFKAQGLKIVPSIIVKGINKTIEGKDVFNWLDSVIKLKNNGPMNQQNDIYLPETGINNNNNNNNNNQFQTPKTNVIKRDKLKILEPPIQNNNIQNNNIQNNNIQNNNIQNNNISNNNISNSNIQNNTPTVKPINQLFGFLQDELSGISDDYAYLLTDNPLPKSFLPYGKEMAIYTAPEGDKLDKTTQDSLIKNLENTRMVQKDEFIKNINLEHEKILNK